MFLGNAAPNPAFLQQDITITQRRIRKANPHLILF
jgi:hypothetical protein